MVPGSASKLRWWLLVGGSAAALVVLAAARICYGDSGRVVELGLAWRALVAGSGDALVDTIVPLRAWQTLVAIGTGAALGLAGALVQGLFRNPLSSPSVLGISSGASLGAGLAILASGGVARENFLLPGMSSSALVPLGALLGAFGVGALVYRLATSAGRVSVPTLLLIGLAVNTVLGGILQWVQAAVLDDNYLSRSILAWGFGSLDDKGPEHALLIWSALGLALCSIPWLAYELDLMQAGLEDAQSLGVDTVRVRWVALFAATLAASAATAVAGQIAFVGLIVPHLVRLSIGASHRQLLPASALLGGLLLLLVDLVSSTWLRDYDLPPGVLLALIGGPFFLVLVWQRRRELALW
jgi:iron complex transport system permease protein